MITRWCSSYRLRNPFRISIVSSTVGGSTITVWKRRSSAPSFSMYLRYSFRVDAPTHWSSPRASAGFSILEASTAPSAAPAPTSVCSSSMKRMMLRFWAISLMIALRRSSNCPRYFVPAITAAMSSASTRWSFNASGRGPRGHLAPEQPQRLGACLLQVHARIGEHLRRDALLLAQQPQQQMLGADVGVVQLARLAHRQLEHFLGARGVWEVGAGGRRRF